MQGSFGEEINQGGTADIHAWAPGQVVNCSSKVSRRGSAPARGAPMIRAVSATKVSYGPCVDGSGLARRIFTLQVGRSSHVFGLFARYT